MATEAQNRETPLTVPALKRRWFRFSLRTVMLVCTIVCLSIAYLRLMQQWQTADARLREASKESGLLWGDDSTQIHVVAEPTDHPTVWRWNFYFPEGKEYRLNLLVNQIPLEDIPESTMKTEHSVWRPGKLTLTLSFDRDKTGEWTIHTQVRNGSVHGEGYFLYPQHIDTGETDWIDQIWNEQFARIRRFPPHDRYKIKTYGAVAGNSPIRFSPNKPVEFFRVNALATSSQVAESPFSEKVDGFVLWIVPREPMPFEWKLAEP